MALNFWLLFKISLVNLSYLEENLKFSRSGLTYNYLLHSHHRTGVGYASC